MWNVSLKQGRIPGRLAGRWNHRPTPAGIDTVCREPGNSRRNPLVHVDLGASVQEVPSAGDGCSRGTGRSGCRGRSGSRDMKSLNGVAVVAAWGVLAAGGAAHAQEAVQWRVEDGGNGHWYGTAAANTWDGALAAASSRGAHLASLTSADENDFARQVFLLAGRDRGYIGLGQISNQSAPDIGWYWTTGEPFQWANWRCFSSELGCAPEDTPCYSEPWGVEDNQANCAAIEASGLWDDIETDIRCDASAASITAVLEWSADCNGDGIVDYGQILDGTLEDANGNGVPDCCDAGTPCGTANRFAVFLRPTDTVRIIGNTSIAGDHTLEWSGYVLDRRVATGTLSSTNVRVWSEQDGLIEDKALGFLSSEGEWRHFGATNGVQCSPGNTHLLTSGAVAPTKTHIAMVRSGSIQTLYVNGVGVASQPTCGNPLNGSSSNHAIGAFVYVGFPSVFNGAAPVAVDWLRISNVARYEGDFTSPDQSEIASDEQTQLLVTFEGDHPWTDLSPTNASLLPGAQVPGGTIPMISTDCDGSGVPDQVEIADGILGDANGNWIPDCCEAGTPCDPCVGDVNFDGIVNGADISVLLGFWGLNGKPVAADINNDGQVDGADLAQMLGSWGECP